MINHSMLIWVAMGGALGASLRYIVSELALQAFGKGFPYGTLIVNVSGSFIMGVLFTALQSGLLGSEPWRPWIGIGFLGALTTFSTFSMDSLLLLQQGMWLKAALNIVINVILCILMAFIGTQVIKA